MHRWMAKPGDNRVRICTPDDDYHMYPDTADALADQLKTAAAQVREAERKRAQEKIKPGARVRLVSVSFQGYGPNSGTEGVVCAKAPNQALVAFVGWIRKSDESSTMWVKTEALEVIE